MGVGLDQGEVDILSSRCVSKDPLNGAHSHNREQHECCELGS